MKNKKKSGRKKMRKIGEMILLMKLLWWRPRELAVNHRVAVKRERRRK
jgi:hypothetical protein